MKIFRRQWLSLLLFWPSPFLLPLFLWCRPWIIVVFLVEMFVMLSYVYKCHSFVNQVLLPLYVGKWIGYSDGLKSVVNGSGLNNSVAGIMAEFSVYLNDFYQYPSPVEVERLQVQIVRQIDSYYVLPSISPLHIINGICYSETS